MGFPSEERNPNARRRFEEILSKYEELRRFFPDDLVMVEEVAEEIARRMPKVPKPREVVPRTVDHKNQLVKNAADLVNTNVGGKLKELVIRSPSQNFGIYILADGITQLSKTYTELTALSPHSDLIDAYPETNNYGELTGNYVVKIGELYWTSDCLISIRIDGDDPITFNNLWVSWDSYIT